jgi:NAD+ synthetase
MPVVDANKLVNELVEAIQSFHRKCGVHRAEIDVSGGVDSAVMVGLLAMALGPDNITAIHIKINSSPFAEILAREVCDVFGVKLAVYDATGVYTDMVRGIREALEVAGHVLDDAEIARDKTIMGSIRSTLRAPIGRAANRLTLGGIRHGTGNECEDRIIRFYQKGGDGEVDTNPIACLSKGEVYQLALGLGVPLSILNAKPTPDLWGSTPHSDEEEIGAYFRNVLKDHPEMTWYSYINLSTGEYIKTGVLERLARASDAGAETPAEYIQFFPELSPKVLADLLGMATTILKQTQHKVNPNIPTLVTRKDLVFKGAITDVLGEVVSEYTNLYKF